MTGVVVEWMRKVTSISANQGTVTFLFFDGGSETCLNDARAIIIRDSHMQSVLVSDVVVGDKLVEVCGRVKDENSNQ